MKNITQRGAALIMALLIVAIVAAIAGGLIAAEEVAIHRTEFKMNADQAYLDQQYASPWILVQLIKMTKEFQQQAKIPIWPQTFSTTLDDGSELQIEFGPAGQRFNLNNLSLPVSNYGYVFINLLEMADPQLTADAANQLLKNVQQQLFTHNKMNANTPVYVVSASELRVVDGITAKIYQALAPYLIAVPDSNISINVNAAPEFLIAGLLSKDRTAANTAQQYRNSNGGFANVGIFLNLPAVQPYVTATPYISQLISVQGDKYYLAHITITRDHLQYQWYSVLQFVANKQTIQTVYVGSSL